MNKISPVKDKTYHKMSDAAYSEDDININLKYKSGKEEWEVIHGLETSNPYTGFDSKVYQDKNGNIIIAYRGTEGSGTLPRKIKDIATDMKYIAAKQTPFNVNMDNQFIDALKLVAEVKKKYPKAKISTTGHSLGGALAAFVAAFHDWNAVTFSAPSVIDILPPFLKNRALAGEFDETIINYIHPKDSIGAGAFGPYPHHIGSTYMIGARFVIENSDYKSFIEMVHSLPVISKMAISNSCVLSNFFPINAFIVCSILFIPLLFFILFLFGWCSCMQHFKLFSTFVIGHPNHYFFGWFVLVMTGNPACSRAHPCAKINFFRNKGPALFYLNILNRHLLCLFNKLRIFTIFFSTTDKKNKKSNS
ncbi:lipase family protein [Bacillus massilinigeriensis]|uniref:lipase family protein n=1 Tax=Bacillus mediterraneensis TaxID=1805474 RepID=UPI0008F83044|nr:DUF2974 domain-containing protein [Bacillus mediterraneensis]